MGFFSTLFTRPDIDMGVNQYKETAGASLLDVRTKEEFALGHIPGALSVPLDRVTTAPLLPENKESPLFIYCQSGARSARAAGLLKYMGYKRVTDLGGIINYSGNLSKGASDNK